MSDVRRVNVWINHKLNHGEEIQNDKAYGSHSLMPWEEYERLRAVVDAARVVALRWDTRGLGNPLPGEKPTDADCLNAMSDALRALDGEPCRNCEGRAWMPSGERCFVCEGTGLQPPMQRALDGEP